ncbi:MAG: hypothetical protein G01um101431_1032 [Parcubacteria group bacterium Gr01-1014_31]|nr:MAG: hypothetical protein G01um101431_1032 [Parcubacteria group bacterium Gr01-1014_31]
MQHFLNNFRAEIAIGVVGTAIIVGIGGWWLQSLAPRPGTAELLAADERTSPDAQPENTAGRVRLASAGAVGVATTYDEALEQYGDWRIQLNDDCQARPPRMTVKSGTSVMLDNRSDDPQTVIANGTSYQIAPYYYRIITVRSGASPHTVYLDCGQGKNVALITAQF